MEWTKHDEALDTIARATTILNCISRVLIDGDLPKGTRLEDIGSALSLLCEELEEAHNTLYDEAK